MLTRLAGVSNLIAPGLIGRVALSINVRLLPHHTSVDLSSTCRSFTLRAIPLETEPMTTRQAFDPGIAPMAAQPLAQRSRRSRAGEYGGLLLCILSREIQIPGFLSVLQRAAPLFEKARSFRLIEIGEQFWTNMDRLDCIDAIRRYHAICTETEAHRTD